MIPCGGEAPIAMLPCVGVGPVTIRIASAAPRARRTRRRQRCAYLNGLPGREVSASPQSASASIEAREPASE